MNFNSTCSVYTIAIMNSNDYRTLAWRRLAAGEWLRDARPAGTAAQLQPCRRCWLPAAPRVRASERGIRYMYRSVIVINILYSIRSRQLQQQPSARSHDRATRKPLLRGTAVPAGTAY